MRPIRPYHPIHIRILPDEWGMAYCGWFEGGYSSLGLVQRTSLVEAVKLYLKVLRADLMAVLGDAAS